MGFGRQKSSADNCKRDLEFKVGDLVYLKISSMKGVMMFVTRGSLVLFMWDRRKF